jgi:hypothetical protein
MSDKARPEAPGPIGTIILGLFTLISLTMAVGAVVPAVGEVMGVRNHGVGGMLGYLAGAGVWGTLTLLAVWMGRSAKAPAAPAAEPSSAAPADADARSAGTPRADPTPAEADTSRADTSPGGTSGGGFAWRSVEPLPDGPGLGTRRLLAVPLGLLAAVMPWLGLAALRGWGRDWFGYTSFTGGEAAPSFTERVLEEVVTPSPLMVVPALVAAYILVRRDAAANWPFACALGAGILLIPGAAMAGVPDLGPVSGFTVAFGLALALIWVSHLFATLAANALTRPVATDVADSALFVSFRLAGQGLLPPRPHLLVKQDEVELRGLGATDGDSGRTQIPWRDLREARVETRRTAGEWTPIPAHHRTITVPAGPVLLLRRDGQDWALPFGDETEARRVLALIAARVRRHM